MTKKLLLTFLTVLTFTASFGQNTDAQRYVEKLDSESPLGDAIWGILAVKQTGDTLANLYSHKKMVPASNNKLITTGLALRDLGEHHRFTTRLGYEGRIQNGVLKGDLYIIGGGDPTIASSDSIATPVNELFARWASFIRDAGIRKIDGRVIGDGRYFEGVDVGSWEYDDLGYDYGASGDGLCFYENIQDFRVVPGAKPQDKVDVIPLYPKTPWISLKNISKTGKAGSGNELVYYNSALSYDALMTGTLGVDSKTRKVACSNRYGALTCAHYFTEYLKANGIVVKDDAGDTSDATADKGSLVIIGQTYSPEVGDIVKICNHRSDNFYAETLFKQLSMSMYNSCTYDIAPEAVKRYLESHGVDTSYGINTADGSGLSRHNYISPDFFVRFLTMMLRSDVFGTYCESLPGPGRGTLTHRMKNEPESVKSRCYFKTGSMGGVRCFSGYILPSDGKSENTIVFSLMTNNVAGEKVNVYDLMGRIVSLLAKEN